MIQRLTTRLATNTGRRDQRLAVSVSCAYLRAVEATGSALRATARALAGCTMNAVAKLSQTSPGTRTLLPISTAAMLLGDFA